MWVHALSLVRHCLQIHWGACMGGFTNMSFAAYFCSEGHVMYEVRTLLADGFLSLHVQGIDVV